MKKSFRFAFACLFVIVLSACVSQNPIRQNPAASSFPTAILPSQVSVTTEPKTDIPSAVNADPNRIVPLDQDQSISICLEMPADSPANLAAQIQVLNENVCKGSGERLPVKLGDNKGLLLGSWVYALVAPFPTVTDGITAESLQNYWKLGNPVNFSVLGLTRATAQSLEALWGKPTGKIEIIAGETLSDWVWQTKSAWAIFPFEELSPRLKVINLDGSSPIQKAFQPEAYALTVPISLAIPESVDESQLLSILHDVLPLTNRDPQKMASVILTGVTALVRATAFGMENEGLEKPAEVIGQTLMEADITHVSNEASFAADCPDPQNEHLSLMFCSKAAYLETLQAIGTDVVELTGDHLNDW